PKGPLVATQAGRALGIRLLLAGPQNDYYRQQVAPLVDGRFIEYVGYLAGTERSKLLGGARALLYPLQGPEPFGLVQVEAMLCGTPVAAMRLGAVPEVIDEGVTGYYTDHLEEYPELVERTFALDRREVRARAEQRYSAGRMAREYAALYQRVLSQGEGGAGWRR